MWFEVGTDRRQEFKHVQYFGCFHRERRHAISSFISWTSSWREAFARSLSGNRLRKACSSSGLAFLKRHLTANFEAAGCGGVCCSVGRTLGLWSVAMIAISDWFDAFGVAVQYSVQTWLQSSSSIAWDESRGSSSAWLEWSAWVEELKRDNR